MRRQVNRDLLEGEREVAMPPASLKEAEALLGASCSSIGADALPELRDAAALETCYGGGACLPFWIRALGGTEVASVRQALGAVMGEIEHQGSVYAATKPVVVSLVRLVRGDLIPLEGTRNIIRSRLSHPPGPRDGPAARLKPRGPARRARRRGSGRTTTSRDSCSLAVSTSWTGAKAPGSTRMVG